MLDWRWRVSNLYHIENEKGKKVPFRPNEEQVRFMDEMHAFNLVLKARQLGFSTLIQLMGLDTCVFHEFTDMGIIAQDRDTAKEIFLKKIRRPYEWLDEGIKSLVTATQDAAEEMTFSNGSHIRVGTSLRGGTKQFLHVSELGKIAAKYPDKAREIKSGALNTVHAGQFVAVESTAEGQEGEFFDMCQLAMAQEAQGIDPGPLEFKLHFAPWWRDRRYRLTTQRTIPERDQVYFAELERQHGIVLDDEQKAWYSQKRAQQKDDMRREFPSYPEEAFDAPIEGAFYTDEIRRAEETYRIGDYPFDPKLGAVYTFWDLGRSDLMTIWFAQRVGASRWRFFAYLEGRNESFPYYARKLKEMASEYDDWVYAGHYLPHDGKRTDLSSTLSRDTTLENLLQSPVHVVKRTKDLAGPELTSAINITKAFFALCAFDRVGCAEGLKHLKNYRREWNDRLGGWDKKPFHNAASDGADGYRTAAQADYDGLLDEDFYDDEYDRDAEDRDLYADEHTGY